MRGRASRRAGAVLRRVPSGKPIRGAEIGVFQGRMSNRLLALCPDLFLYMVDPWDPELEWHASPGTLDSICKRGLGRERWWRTKYMEAIRVTGFAQDRRLICKAYSKDAAPTIADESLDFVFIDGDHSFEGCSADIHLWLPKVKEGGVIGGHDYDSPGFPEVSKAVKERFDEIELDVEYTWFVRVKR